MKSVRKSQAYRNAVKRWNRLDIVQLRKVLAGLKAAADAAEMYRHNPDDPSMDEDMQHVAGTCALLLQAMRAYLPIDPKVLSEAMRPPKSKTERAIRKAARGYLNQLEKAGRLKVRKT